MLTRKQFQLLTFIDKTLRKTGISPSYDEMKAALNLKSKSGIHRLISGLEERGAEGLPRPGATRIHGYKIDTVDSSQHWSLLCKALTKIHVRASVPCRAVRVVSVPTEHTKMIMF